MHNRERRKKYFVEQEIVEVVKRSDIKAFSGSNDLIHKETRHLLISFKQKYLVVIRNASYICNPL